MEQLSVIEALDVLTRAIHNTIPNELQESNGEIYLAKDGKQLSDGITVVDTTDVIEKGNMRPVTSNAVAIMFERIMELINNLEGNEEIATSAVLGKAVLGKIILGKEV